MESIDQAPVYRSAARLFRGCLAQPLARLQSALATRRGLAELRAMDSRELRDLGLDRGGIGYAAAQGRDGC